MKIRVEKPERIDRYLSSRFAELSRAQIAKIIKAGGIKVGGKAVNPSFKLKRGDLITGEMSDFKLETKIVLPPESIPISIIFENADFAVIDKPAGLTVHPGKGVRTNTLVQVLLTKFPNLSTVNGPERPGIVHRLDRDTSGLILIAKNDEVHLEIKKLFQERKIEKTYSALVWGNLKIKTGIIEAPIARNEKNRVRMSVSATGRAAKTFYETMEDFNGYSLLKVKPITGRTHQIRVHFQSLGHPLAGDLFYAGKKRLIQMKKAGIERLFLHATEIEFSLKGEKYHFISKPPQELAAVLRRLRQRSS